VTWRAKCLSWHALRVYLLREKIRYVRSSSCYLCHTTAVEATNRAGIHHHHHHQLLLQLLLLRTYKKTAGLGVYIGGKDCITYSHLTGYFSNVIRLYGFQSRQSKSKKASLCVTRSFHNTQGEWLVEQQQRRESNVNSKVKSQLELSC
jgi:hypothetical protein